MINVSTSWHAYAFAAAVLWVTSRLMCAALDVALERLDASSTRDWSTPSTVPLVLVIAGCASCLACGVGSLVCAVIAVIAAVWAEF